MQDAGCLTSREPEYTARCSREARKGLLGSQVAAVSSQWVRRYVTSSTLRNHGADPAERGEGAGGGMG